MAASNPIKPRLESLVVGQRMTPAPHSIGKEQPLSVAHDLMRAHRLRHLPVLENGRIVGILSERDLYYLETIPGVDEKVERVEEGMSQDVYSVPADARLSDVVTEMADRRYGCAVVVQGPKVVGLFTTTDALELLSELLRASSAKGVS